MKRVTLEMGGNDAAIVRKDVDVKEMAPKVFAGARELEPRTLPLSNDAREMLIAYSDHVEGQQAPGGDFDNITGYASKSAEQAARIAGVLTAWSDLNAPAVTLDAVKAGIALADFYLSEARRLADAANVSEKIDRAEALRKWLLERFEHSDVMPRDIVQRAPIRALRESPAAREAVGILEKHGWLIRLPEGSEVRGTVRKEAYRIAGPRHAL